MDFEHFEMILRLGKTSRHQGRAGICRAGMGMDFLGRAGQETMVCPCQINDW